MDEAAIELRGVHKAFARGRTALQALDMSVPRGAVYGLIGRNGAGKTTALRVLMGLLRADAGQAHVLGMDMWNVPPSQRARVAYVPQAPKVHGWMTTGELCHYVSHFYPRWDQPYARDLARQFDLPWDVHVGTLSGGMQRKIPVLLAFAARPEVLLLDEPAAGLDPIARRHLIDEIIDILGGDGGCTVVFSTHIVSDLERIADHVGIIDHGRMLNASPLDELQGRVARVQVVFRDGPMPDDFSLPGAIREQRSEWSISGVVQRADADQVEELRRRPGVQVEVFPLGLEDIFIEIVGAGERAGAVEEEL